MIYDVVGWMKKYIFTPVNQSQPHAFKFERENDKVQMSYRLWSSGFGDRKWSKAGTIIDPAVVKKPIKLAVCTFPKLDMTDLKKKVFSENLKNKLTREQKKEWERFVTELEERKELWDGYDNNTEFNEWPLTTLPKQVNLKKRKRGSEDGERMEMLKRLEEKNQTMKKVNINCNYLKCHYTEAIYI